MQSFDCNPELCAIYELCQAWDKHYDKTCIIHTDYDYEGVTNITINHSCFSTCKGKYEWHGSAIIIVIT